MVQSFWMNVDEKQQLQNQQENQQIKQENQEQVQSNKSISKEEGQLASNTILQPNGDNSNAQEVAQSIWNPKYSALKIN